MPVGWEWMLAAAAAVLSPADELTVTPGEPVAATVEGKPARLLVGSGGLDRLTLDGDFVVAADIKPTLLIGGAELSVAGRREFEGHNRTLMLSIAGQRRKARAFWFDGAPDSGVDGRVGPWGLPQARVTFVLAPRRASETVTRLSLQGDPNTGSYTGVRLNQQGVYLSFAVEDTGRLPVATAALGAMIAQEYGGVLEGPSWDVEVLMGVKRPVCLLKLARPMEIGPLSYDRIVVRVRDRIDDSGRGAVIAEAGEPTDPDEVVVAAKAGGPAPAYGMTIPNAALAGCSRLTFDKTARKIELACRPLATR